MTRALIVIDVQNDYFPGGALPLHQAEEVEARILAAISKAQVAGDKVILIRHVSPLKSGLFADGSEGSQLRPAIAAAAPEAPVVIKHVADSFQDTDLAAQLHGIDTLLICGMMTQNCVAFTAMSDLAPTADITVLGDLCTAPSEIVHMVALNALGSKRSLVTAAGAGL